MTAIKLKFHHFNLKTTRLQELIGVFGDWAASKEWMRRSPDFHANPIGVFVDPAKIAQASAGGEAFEEIHRRAMSGELSPEQPVEIPGQ
jgi:hypothetical protein